MRGKWVFISLKNSFPTFVFTVALNGGLKQIKFLFLLFFFGFVVSSYSNFALQPLFRRVSSYSEMALLNSSLLYTGILRQSL